MNLIEMTLTDAVEALAKRAADLRTRPRSYQEKQAAGLSDVLTSVGTQVKENPYLQHSLVGAGLGAGVGGLSTMLGNQGKEEKDRRSVIQSMLTGGLAGGAIGGGASLASKMLGSKPPEGGVEAMKPGQFKDPTTGKLMQVDPETLRKNPALAGKVRELSQPMDPINSAVTGVVSRGMRLLSRAIPGMGAFADKDDWINNNIPVTGNVLPPLFAADMMANSPSMQTGHWAGYGYVDPRHANNPDMLAEGLKARMGNAEGGKATAYEQLLGDRKRIEEIAKYRNGRGATNLAGDVHTHTETVHGDPIKQAPKSEKVMEEILDTAGKKIGERSKEVYVPQPDLPGQSKTVEHKLTREDMHQAMSEGAHAQAGKANKANGLDHEIPRVFRSPLNKNRVDSHVGSMFGNNARGYGRAALYLGAPLLEHTARQWLGQNQRETDLRELMRHVAKEVK